MCSNLTNEKRERETKKRKEKKREKERKKGKASLSFILWDEMRIKIAFSMFKRFYVSMFICLYVSTLLH